ncbi:MAG: DUF2207 domain-containing protein, partial [Actinobacteria bacterium]
MRTRRFGLLLAGALCAAAVLLPAAPAFAKEYSMPKSVIEAQIMPDGSMRVIETRTFDFADSFTRVYWDLPRSGGELGDAVSIEVTGMQVAGVPAQRIDAPDAARPAGKYAVTDDGSMVHAEVYHQTAYEAKDFTITYVVNGAVARWDDTAELYWKFVSDRWENPTGRVEVHIKFPDGVTKQDVSFWMHMSAKQLAGVSSADDDGAITLVMDDLPAMTWLEGRALFPAAALPEAKVTPGARKAEVLAEEKAWETQSNAARAAAKAGVWGCWGLGLLISLGGLAFSISLFLKKGREYKPKFVGDYFREDPRPDLRPAIVGSLMRFGSVEDADMGAELMDLANTGVIQMMPVTEREQGLFGTKETQTYQLKLDSAKTGGLHEVDRALVDLLFTQVAGSDTLTVEGLKAYAKAHAETYVAGVNGWKAVVKAEAEKLGFFEQGGRVAQWTLGTLVIAVGVGTVVCAVNAGSFVLGAIGVICAAVILVLAFNAPRRSSEANELFAQYNALKKYLTDFSRLNEAPPTHVALWERFLVLAVVFGVAKQVIEALKVRMPEILKDPGFAQTYWWVNSGAGYAAPIESVTQGIQ